VAPRNSTDGEQAVGKVSHKLTQTIFPARLEEINAELFRTGRWEGELIHTKRDGTQVTVASRWALQRDEQGNRIAILETNNDITERKRAEYLTRHVFVPECTELVRQPGDDTLGASIEFRRNCLGQRSCLRDPHADPLLRGSH
jgi:hypothetical protein